MRSFILNVPIDSLTMSETIQMIDRAIINRVPIHHAAINVAKLINILKDKELYKSIISSDIINADGTPLVWASKFLGNPLPERVAGIDLMQNLVELAFQKKYKIYLFGGKEEVVKKVKEFFSVKYSPELIAGYRNGYFNPGDEIKIATEIHESRADILFVAMTSPLKEHFLNKYKDTLKIPFIMGVGGSFDVIAGVTKRAPLWMQKLGLEWLFRIIQEPNRMWKRYARTNPVFIYLIIKEVLKHIFNSPKTFKFN